METLLGRASRGIREEAAVAAATESPAEAQSCGSQVDPRLVSSTVSGSLNESTTG